MPQSKPKAIHRVDLEPPLRRSPRLVSFPIRLRSSRPSAPVRRSPRLRQGVDPRKGISKLRCEPSKLRRSPRLHASDSTELWSQILRVYGFQKPFGLNIVFPAGEDPFSGWDRDRGRVGGVPQKAHQQSVNINGRRFLCLR